MTRHLPGPAPKGGRHLAAPVPEEITIRESVFGGPGPSVPGYVELETHGGFGAGIAMLNQK